MPHIDDSNPHDDSDPHDDRTAEPAVTDPPPRGGPARRWAAVRATGEAGMSTAEYAVGTVAACAFAAVLYRVVTGSSIVTGLTHLVESALATLS